MPPGFLLESRGKRKSPSASAESFLQRAEEGLTTLAVCCWDAPATNTSRRWQVCQSLMQPRLGFIVFQSIRQLSSNVDSEPASLPRSKKNPITHSEHSPHNQITLVRKTFDLAPDFSRKHTFESLSATCQHPADRFPSHSQSPAGTSQEDLSLSTHIRLTHPTGHLQPQ